MRLEYKNDEAGEYMENLTVEYKKTFSKLRGSYESLKELRDTKKEQQLALMAKLTLITTWEDERILIEQEIVQLEKDMKLIAAMRSDVEYVIEWLETGKRPGNKRGIERRAAYQRVRPVDPIKLQAYVANTSGGGAVQAAGVTERERERIEYALGQLTPRERECYVMVRGNGLSYGEAAATLGLAKGSVQWFIKSADTKLRLYSEQSS